jgi:hypothetical protein
LIIASSAIFQHKAVRLPVRRLAVALPAP